LEIEPDGALNAKKVYPEAILIMIAPPSKEELFARLRGRGTEKEDVILERVARADYELSKADKYDYVVVNDDLNTAVKQILKIISK
jgi:guanylate kinase